MIVYHRAASETADELVNALAPQVAARLGLVDPPAPDGASASGKGGKKRGGAAGGSAPTPDQPEPESPTVAVLTWGDVGGAGGFVVVGSAARVAVVGPAVAAAMDGRGGQGRNAARFQYSGKAKRLLADADLRALLS